MSGPKHPTHPHLDGAMWTEPGQIASQFYNCNVCRQTPCACSGTAWRTNVAAGVPQIGNTFTLESCSRCGGIHTTGIACPFTPRPLSLSDSDIDRIAKRVVEMLQPATDEPDYIDPSGRYRRKVRIECSTCHEDWWCGHECGSNGIRHDEGEG